MSTPPLFPLNLAAFAPLTDGRLLPWDREQRADHPYAGFVNFQGLRCNIENPKGSVRSGVSPGGQPWSSTMTASYGEIDGTTGADGDPVDIFLGDDLDAPTAYVIHRKHPGTEVYDEDKVVAGVKTQADAEALFRANYDKPGNHGGVTAWPVAELREYLAHPGHERRRLDQPQRVREAMRKGVRFVVPLSALRDRPLFGIPRAAR